MSIQKLTDDLNIISSLSNRPTQTAEELKQEFDKAGNIIKNYLNNILTPNIDTEIEEKVNNSVSSIEEKVNNSVSSIDEAMSTLENNVNTIVSGLQTTIDVLEEEVANSNTTIKNQIKDIIKTQSFSKSFTVSAFSTQVQSMGTLSTPSGYTLIGLVEYSSTSSYFLNSFNFSGTTVYGKVHNTEKNERTATVACKALFLKNNLS